MKTLKIDDLEQIAGGGFCNSVAVADVVVAVGAYGAWAGWIALNPIGAGFLAGAGVGLAITSLGCAIYHS